MASNYTRQDLEILISTMNQDSLDFLIPMFPFTHFSNFSLLIVNQTTPNQLLTSDYPLVRIINSFEKGLSKSRNTAIKNANKKIGLIADDDVIYEPDFDLKIIQAFNRIATPVITFNHQRIGLEYPQNLATNSYLHNYKSIWNVCSIEIAFKIADLKEKLLYFNEDFGLGSYFETAEEYLFLRNVLRLNVPAHFYPATIVSHPLLTSGDDQGSDKLVFARAALSYELRTILTYIWLPKYLCFLYRYKYITQKQWLHKFKVGISGIKKYKELKNNTFQQ